MAIVVLSEAAGPARRSAFQPPFGVRLERIRRERDCDVNRLRARHRGISLVE